MLGLPFACWFSAFCALLHTQRRRLLLQALAVWAPQLQPLLLQLPLVSSPPAPALEEGTALERQGPAVASTSCDPAPAPEPPAHAGCGAASGVGAMRTRASQRVRGHAGSGACKAPAGPNHSSSTNNHSQSTVPYGRQQEGTPTTGAPHLPASAATQGTGASSQRTPSWRGVGAGSGNGRDGSQVAHGRAPAGPSAAFVSPTRHQHSSACGVGAAGAAQGPGQQRRAASRLAVTSPPPAAGASQVVAGGGKGRAAAAAGAGRTTPSAGATLKGTSGAMAAPPPLPPRLGARAAAAAAEEGRAADAAAATAGGSVPAVGSAEAVAARRSLCGLLEAVGEQLMDAEVVRHLHTTGKLRALVLLVGAAA